LNIFNQMPQMDTAIGIRQGGSHQKFACHESKAKVKGAILANRQAFLRHFCG
jgi:hypothetical protein